jgi:type II secretory pathway component GspD/PulD (secretin)
MKTRNTNRFAITRWLAAVFAGLFLFAASAADLTVIDLQHRRADEVIPILRPLVGSDVALSGIDYKLLVRGNGADVARIRDALSVIDRAPKQLLVSVRYSGSPARNDSNIGVGGTVDNRGAQVVVRGGTTISTASDDSISSVRVLEGNGARIATGQSVPVVTPIIMTSQSGNQSASAAVVLGTATDYREISSGFNVMPRVNGDRVLLDIAARQERPADLGSGSATVQRASTTISGRLGEWIELGGVSSSTSEQRSGVSIGSGSQRITTQSDQRSIAVKVELVQ